ncbi:MAG: family 43 glycosylhydrolase [Marinilabiliaceae bacterium]|nr:family 43 glycosylhydrolase [Marinilabiliaceae bacterium]
MNKKLFLPILLMPLAVNAQNPIIHNQFCADPTARVFNGRLYLYPSHDIIPPQPLPQGVRADWFCMEDYHVFSSDNLVDWTDHGVILNQKDVPWGNPGAYSMWAPDCVERNGKYYFYYPDAPKEGRGFSIGVAIADKPEGPFTPMASNIEGVNGIDPCVLLASDGNAYLFWGPGLCAKLKDNMTEIADDTPTETFKFGEREFTMRGVNCLKGLPNRQAEGPFAFEYNGNYYLTYPYVRENTEVLGYAMSKNPMGPYEYKGIIMAEHPNGCWTNHHSIVNFKGQWYIFYHQNDYSPENDKRRSVRIEKLAFNADGTIQEVKPTLRGVGIVNALSRIEVDRYAKGSGDLKLNFMDEGDKFLGWEVNFPAKTSWLSFTDVDFSALQNGYVTANVKADKNTKFYLREKSAKGKVIAEFNVVCVTEGQFRRDYSGQWLTVTAPVKYCPKGISDIYITTQDGGLSIDYVQFKNHESYFAAPTSASIAPDSDGFIRRWFILEPIAKDIRSNTDFTDTYLKNAFHDTEYRKIFDVVPTDGKKVKFQKQSLTWHKLDATRYNMKLFRFAETYGTKLYGVLFSGITVIKCDDEIRNVRLSAGSNSASSWYLNGEEILLMQGDRRMVKDDCVSGLVILKKGINILSVSVINGPGMSDFCARFIDENGNAVTNYNIE